MKNVEHAEDTFFLQTETGDDDGTHEQKEGYKPGSQTVYIGNSSKTKVKKKQPEKVVFTD